jgi:hypothetical protein
MSLPVCPACPVCGQLLALEAELCPGCSSLVGYAPARGGFYAAGPNGGWRDAGGVEAVLTECANRGLGVCNWLFDPAPGRTLCDACRHNRTIPDLAVPGVLARWRKVEIAKKRCIDPLIRLGIPALLSEPGGFGLAFDILYDPAAEQGEPPELHTAHQAGVVTINLIEADDAARERARLDFGESYRTLVGHFRHEVGHYYWYRLVEKTLDLEPFRVRFGDERADYAEAMGSYYARGDASGWEDDFVSRYATMHPWEDFAETFAHYLHIVDTLATVGGFGLSIEPRAGKAAGQRKVVDFDPYTADTATLVDAWIPLAFALNAVNRSMGQPDLYPFRMTPQIVAKIDFVNRLLAFGAGRWAAGENEQAGLRAMLATLGHGVELDGSR